MKLYSQVFTINPDAAKACGLQNQGLKGGGVVLYREPLRHTIVSPQDFPEGKQHAKRAGILGTAASAKTRLAKAILHIITDYYLYLILLFMQLWG
jgi:hypothetical protein